MVRLKSVIRIFPPTLKSQVDYSATLNLHSDWRQDFVPFSTSKLVILYVYSIKNTTQILKAAYISEI